MQLAAIIAIIQAAIVVAPDVEAFIIKAKDFISALFSAKAITKEQQDAVHAHIDSLAAMAKAGIVPPEFQVQPDPVQ